MRLLVRASLAAAAALLLSGCTTVSVEPSDNVEGSGVSSVAPPSYLSEAMSALVEQLECTDPEPAGVEIHAMETAHCAMGAEDVAICLFDSDTLRDSWVADSRADDRYYVVGDGWGAATASPDAASTIAEKLDGKLAD